MSEPVIGVIGLVVLVILLFMKMPIGFSLILVGFGGLAMLAGFDAAMVNLRLIPLRTVASYSLAVVPLFMLMGIVTANSGISKDLYNTAYKWVGRYRGGLAMATVLASGGFAAICGQSTAATATMGKIVEPEMKRYNYDPKLAAGSVAAGGTLGTLIPPSLSFILYGFLTELSVGRLFMAGILPGVTEMIVYIGIIALICWRNPSLGPAGPKTSIKGMFSSLLGAGPMLCLFLLVMGGIYMGFFTPTEAGAIGAAGAVLIALVMRRLTPSNFISSLSETGKLAAAMLILFLGATVFNTFMAVSELPWVLSEFIAGLQMPTIAILIIILFVYLFLGLFLDIIACMVLTIPILFPVIISLGIDPIWYGVLMVRCIEVGLITPPLGMNSYVLAAAMNVPVSTIFRGIVPFIIADFIHIAILIAVPAISLFLPGTMYAR